MQAPTEVQAVLEVHSEVKEGMCIGSVLSGNDYTAGNLAMNWHTSFSGGFLSCFMDFHLYTCLGQICSSYAY